MRAERKELFSEKVSAGSRTYFFNVKGSADGKKYLVINESRRDVGRKSYEHRRVMVFEEHVLAFHKGLKKALEFMKPGNKPKRYDVEQIRRRYPKAYVKWTEDEDMQLKNEYTHGKAISELAVTFQRQPSAIRSRLEKLRLL
jgi:hypothetical protein